MRKATEHPARAAAWALLIFGLALVWATSITWLGPGGHATASLTARAWAALVVGLVGGFGSSLLGVYLLESTVSAGGLRLEAPSRRSNRSRRALTRRYHEGAPSNDWADEQIT